MHRSLNIHRIISSLYRLVITVLVITQYFSFFQSCAANEFFLLLIFIPKQILILTIVPPDLPHQVPSRYVRQCYTTPPPPLILISNNVYYTYYINVARRTLDYLSKEMAYPQATILQNGNIFQPASSRPLSAIATKCASVLGDRGQNIFLRKATSAGTEVQRSGLCVKTERDLSGFVTSSVWNLVPGQTRQRTLTYTLDVRVHVATILPRSIV